MSTPPGITVTGSAAVDVEPDIVVADLGVDVRESDVSTALRAAEEAVGRMRDELAGRGVERPDMRTAQTSIWREDRTDDRGEITARAVHVVLGLRVTLRDVAAAGDQVHAALAVAGDHAQMNALAFASSDVAGPLARARAAAFEDARTVAGAYAAQAGRALGPVTAVVEGTAGQPPAPLRARVAMDAAVAGSVPIEPGQQSVGASVTVTWAFAD